MKLSQSDRDKLALLLFKLSRCKVAQEPAAELGAQLLVALDTPVKGGAK